MIHLKNELLEVAVSEKGAELRSIVKDGYEVMWSGDACVWGRTAPVLFPTLCALRDGTYTLEGKRYRMPKHGFVRDAWFSVEEKCADSVTLLYEENEETLAVYPFAFAFRVTVRLLGSSVAVTYRVTNKNEKEMYFSVGAHEAYATPEGIEDYDILFPQTEDLSTILLDGGLLSRHKMLIAKNTDFLPLYEKYFILDTLIFENLRSREVTLRNRKTERAIHVAFPDCDYLALWHAPSAGYLCIEPWSGLPDYADHNYDLTEKAGILSLAARGEYKNTHIITV